MRNGTLKFLLALGAGLGLLILLELTYFKLSAQNYQKRGRQAMDVLDTLRIEVEQHRHPLIVQRLDTLSTRVERLEVKVDRYISQERLELRPGSTPGAPDSSSSRHWSLGRSN